MSRVLAFDFGASTGRSILAEYENGRLSYNKFTVLTTALLKKTDFYAGILNTF